MSNLIVKSIVEKKLSELSQTKNERGLIDYLQTIVFKEKCFKHIKDNYLVFLLKFGNLDDVEKRQLIEILENREKTFTRRNWIREIQLKYSKPEVRQLVFN